MKVFVFDLLAYGEHLDHLKVGSELPYPLSNRYFKADVAVRTYAEHLDANRFFGPEYENEFIQFLTAKYRDRHIDIVIVFGVSALDFVARRREQLWPSVPVVFGAIDQATISRTKLPDNVTGATMQLTLLDMVKVAQIAPSQSSRTGG